MARPGRSSFFSGELKAGGGGGGSLCLYCIWLERSYNPWTACIHFHDSYHILLSSLTSVSILCIGGLSITYFSYCFWFLTCSVQRPLWAGGGGGAGFWAQMALASPVAISGPKKVLIFRAHPFQWPSKWMLPHQNHFVPSQINNRYINSYYVWLEHSFDPPEGPPGQHAYTFMICILLTSLTSVSIFSFCCHSRYLSQWSDPLAPNW